LAHPLPEKKEKEGQEKTMIPRLLALLLLASLVASAQTITSQPAGSSNFFYPNSFSARQLQGAGSGGPLVFGHLMPNSDAVMQNVIQFDSNGFPQQSAQEAPGEWSGGMVTGSFASPGANDAGSATLYLGQASDPVYQVTNVSYPYGCGKYFAASATNNGGEIGNLKFHAPLQAQFSGYGGAGDSVLSVWDVSNDTNDISNGHALGFYSCCGQPLTLPAAGGHAGTIADPIPMTADGGSNYCAWDDPLSTSPQGQWGSGTAGNGSNSPGVFGNMDRLTEVLSGHISHAGQGEVQCESTAGGTEPNVVFPATIEPSTGGIKCTNPQALAPPNGAHYFLDYTTAQLDCMNPAMASCTGADGNGITKLDAFHFTLIEQLTLYGWYESDTGGLASDPTNGGTGWFEFYHVESSQPYAYYASHGFTSPNSLTGTCTGLCYQTFENYMQQHCPSPPSGQIPNSLECYDNQRASPNSAHQWTTRLFNNISGNMPGPQNGAFGCSQANGALGKCGPGLHIHIADPCVDVAAAGLTSSGSWNACPGSAAPSPPTGLSATVQTQ
jgi:hypothetical protein